MSFISLVYPCLVLLSILLCFLFFLNTITFLKALLTLSLFYLLFHHHSHFPPLSLFLKHTPTQTQNLVDAQVMQDYELSQVFRITTTALRLSII